MPSRPRIAIACSGLGHIQRGIESWAFDLARGLRHAGMAVELFGGGAMDGVTALRCARRTGAANQRVTTILRRLGGWRYGFGSTYETEQSTFALSLWPRIRRGFDILHVQDPTLALWFEQAHRAGISQPQVIYANGTGEGVATMRRFRTVQLLTEQARAAFLVHESTGTRTFVIPNFIDTGTFKPGDRRQAREAFGLPHDRTIVLCCAAIRRFHKRIDHLLDAFHLMLRQTGEDAMLVVAGARESDTDTLTSYGTQLLGDRVRFLIDVPRHSMPMLYRSADTFVLASLQEMFGIVLLEAMASGLPVACHDNPDFRSIVGPVGSFGDLTNDDALAAAISAAITRSRDPHSADDARRHVEETFSETAIMPRFMVMYDSVMRAPPGR